MMAVISLRDKAANLAEFRCRRTARPPAIASIFVTLIAIDFVSILRVLYFEA